MIRLLAGSAVLVTVLASTAFADTAPNTISVSSFNPDDAVAPTSTVEGAGVKVGEGTELRPVLGVETGYVSNVFYQDRNETPAGILRLIAQIGVGSLGDARLAPSAMAASDDPSQAQNLGVFRYRADLRLAYDLIFGAGSDAAGQAANDTGGLSIGADVRGQVNPMGTVSFGFEDDFRRMIRAANFETDSNTNRDINQLRLLLMVQPHNSTLSGYLYYTNLIDVFERGEQKFANRMSNRVGLHPQWRFLPQTQAYLDLSWGNVTSLSDSDSVKQSSYPLTVRAGLATLLSFKTTLNLDAGYTNGFYSGGPSFSAPVIGATVGYRYSPLGRVMVGYTLQYEDSINANYYRDHIIRASIEQQVDPVTFVIQPEVHFRQYDGVTSAVPDIMGPDTRNDFIFAVVAGVHYNFRNWIAATLDYQFATVQTDQRYTSGGQTDDPSFTRHEILAGVRVAL